MCHLCETKALLKQLVPSSGLTRNPHLKNQVWWFGLAHQPCCRCGTSQGLVSSGAASFSLRTWKTAKEPTKEAEKERFVVNEALPLFWKWLGHAGINLPSHLKRRDRRHVPVLQAGVPKEIKRGREHSAYHLSEPSLNFGGTTNINRWRNQSIDEMAFCRYCPILPHGHRHNPQIQSKGFGIQSETYAGRWRALYHIAFA